MHHLGRFSAFQRREATMNERKRGRSRDSGDAEERAVEADVSARLRTRGVEVSAADSAEDLAGLLSALERFEAAVERHGGDLMVDDLRSSEPDDRHFVVPRRGAKEAARAYIARVDEATANLRHHGPRPD
jgi:hypothetical protein